MNRIVRFGIRVLALVLVAQVCHAAELSGNYIAEMKRGTALPVYARVTLNVVGAKVTGS